MDDDARPPKTSLLSSRFAPAACAALTRAALTCAALALACGDDKGEESDASAASEPVTHVYLRLRNVSDVSFDAVLVQVTERIEFGALTAGAYSEYLEADGIYSYAYVEATSGEARYNFQPTDYIGDTPLRPGYYTYVLDTGAGDGVTWLDLRMVRDPVPD